MHTPVQSTDLPRTKHSAAMDGEEQQGDDGTHYDVRLQAVALLYHKESLTFNEALRMFWFFVCNVHTVEAKLLASLCSHQWVNCDVTA